MDEQLDFCRVKKIDEKGFGFLKSLYYPFDIFFHFSQIKKDEFREKLNDMKRGEFLLYFLSKDVPGGKRKVKQIWYSLKDVPQEYYSSFINRIIEEFQYGKTNLFDLLYAYKEFKELDLLNNELIERILTADRILKLPTTIIPYLTEEEIVLFKKLLNYDQLKISDKKPFWFDDIP
jgi:cold shock CspA family protein